MRDQTVFAFVKIKLGKVRMQGDGTVRSQKPSGLQSCYLGPCEPHGFCSHTTLVFHTFQMRFRQTL